ncbi:hypothetical protein PsorP6_008488 [Peronosclerospora sorghi]|uniref:Uncharacterized protein n=1 Tax=Peronosclerospora sorghi TaxID=230839 RepID=A0ACC0W8K5_9STRA|nr:hypothetical protein PsorP6_008488 [Peronosclerospora sorghi]
MSLSSTLGPRQAAENAIKKVHSVASKCPSSIARGSPYGELVIVDILEAKGLAMDQDETGGALSFHVSLHLGKTSRRTNPTSEESLAVNERFVFWLPSSPTTDQKTLDIFNLGEVHLSLAMPLNETFTDSYPLICRSNGVKRGSMHVGLHRFVLTPSLLLDAAKTLGKRESCLKLQKERAAQWKAEQIDKRRAHGRQVKLEMDVTKRKQTQLESQQKVIRERRSAWRAERDLSPEKIARRNANIQKFIQEELDKQAQHSREQKQREREEERERAEAGVVQQDTVRLQEDKDGAETWSELAHMTASFEDFEYKVML